MKIPGLPMTIRFKLTLWYGVILILFSVALLILINLAMQRYYTQLFLGPAGDVYEITTSSFLESLRTYSVISLGAVVVFGAIGGYFLSGRLLKPIGSITSLASSISSRNLAERIQYQGVNDEVKYLADTFDNMLQRLESAFDSQKQFIQDASHELKTPISIARTNIEVLEMKKRITKNDYETLTEVLKLSLERMNKLSDKLLLLIDDNQARMKWESLDIAMLVHELTLEYDNRIKAAGLFLETNMATGDMLVNGDALQLKQAISNLIENAIKYSYPGGVINISVETKDSRLLIEVQDRGIGIPKADRERIFQRFYRVDKSRDRAQGGSGLGLAIAKKMIENHDGTISVESNAGQGSLFQISLPLINHR